MQNTSRVPFTVGGQQIIGPHAEITAFRLVGGLDGLDGGEQLADRDGLTGGQSATDHVPERLEGGAGVATGRAAGLAAGPIPPITEGVRLACALAAGLRIQTRKPEARCGGLGNSGGRPHGAVRASRAVVRLPDLRRHGLPGGRHGEPLKCVVLRQGGVDRQVGADGSVQTFDADGGLGGLGDLGLGGGGIKGSSGHGPSGLDGTAAALREGTAAGGLGVVVVAVDVCHGGFSVGGHSRGKAEGEAPRCSGFTY